MTASRPGYRPTSAAIVGDELFCMVRDCGLFPAIVRYTDDTRIIVESHTGYFYGIDRRTFRDKDGDVWMKKSPPQVQYLNVYDDGTVGATIHYSMEDAIDRSKYGKTRIGIIEREVQDAKVLRSKVHSTLPTLRSYQNPLGINPYA